MPKARNPPVKCTLPVRIQPQMYKNTLNAVLCCFNLYFSSFCLIPPDFPKQFSKTAEKFMLACDENRNEDLPGIGTVTMGMGHSGVQIDECRFHLFLSILQFNPTQTRVPCILVTLVCSSSSHCQTVRVVSNERLPDKFAFYMTPSWYIVSV